MLETKTVPLVELKADSAAGSGAFEGYASVFGGVDTYADTIVPGAYSENLPEFLRDGFIAWGHNWADPIATPTACREDSRGLFLTAQFHSHPDAQRARTITAERVERGKSMGLSIGFDPLEWEMRKVEEPVRNQWGEFTDQVRVLTKIKLYEVSLVTVPADGAARVTDAKGRHTPFDAHSHDVRVAVAEWLARVRTGAEIRASEGKEDRAIPEARRRHMAEVRGSMVTAIGEIDALLQEIEPAPRAANLRRLRFDFDRRTAAFSRQYGVPA